MLLTSHILLVNDLNFLIYRSSRQKATIEYCKRKLCQKFLKCDHHVATWERVIEALKKADQQNIAEQVEKHIENMKITQ